MDRSQTVETVLERFGSTFVEQAEISLKDKPAPLYQLLVLSTLLRRTSVGYWWRSLRTFGCRFSDTAAYGGGHLAAAG